MDLNPGLARSYIYNMMHTNGPTLKEKEKIMLIDTLRSKRTQAMRDKDKATRTLLTVLLGILENKAKTDGTEITDSMIMQACKKLKRTNDDVIKIVGPGEAADFLHHDNEILEEFLPKQLTEEEIRDLMEVLSIKNIGQAMKFFKENYDGRVDNKLVAQIARETITS